MDGWKEGRKLGMCVGVIWFVFACSPTSTDYIYTRELELQYQIYDETFGKKLGKKIGWRIEPPLCSGSIYTMEDGLFHGQSNLMVSFLCSSFFEKKSIYKAFGPLIGCKSNVDQEE